MTVDQALKVAIQLQHSGQLAEAVVVYEKILAVQPNEPDALHQLGHSFLQQGNLEDAAGLIRRAITVRPNVPDYHNSLGSALEAMGLYDDAISAYFAALHLLPDSAPLYNNIAYALQRKGALEEAEFYYRKAVGIDPTHPEIRLNLGATLMTLGRMNDAIGIFLGTLQSHPNHAKTHNNLGNALKHLGRLDEAIEAYQNTIQCDPNIAAVFHNLGNVLKDQGDLDKALECYKKAVSMEVNPEIHSSLLFAMHFHPEYDPRTLIEEHRNWDRIHAVPLRGNIRPYQNDPNPDRRLKIGYVSADFTDHAVGRFLLPLLRNHDRRSFEIFCYSSVVKADGLTEEFRTSADTWRSITERNDANVAELIREDMIDILVDLSAHSAGNRLLVFARKPAPVQLSYLAYPSTTGLSAIDYSLTDPYLAPRDRLKGEYSEELIRLPETYWCYEQYPVDVNVGVSPAIVEGEVTFGSLNTFGKTTTPTLAVWCELLRRLPKSRMILHAGPGSHRPRLHQRLAADGINPERLTFVDRKPTEEYLALYNQIDIALDPFPYTGGTTTFDALWMGVPVVSLAGETSVSRGGLSILSNLGHPELVARTTEDYIRTAVELAMNLPRLRQLRSVLRKQLQASVLMDSSRFTRNLELAYREIWKRWTTKSSADPALDLERPNLR